MVEEGKVKDIEKLEIFTGKHLEKRHKIKINLSIRYFNQEGYILRTAGKRNITLP